MLVLVLSLQGCGGGGGGTAFNLPIPVSTPTFSVLTATEASVVSDGPIALTGVDPYAVEFDGVVDANVTTTDKALRPDANGDNCDTFTRVNDYPDSYDPLLQTYCSPVPEIASHLAIASAGNTPGYIEDNLATNATFRLRGSSSRLAPQKSYRIKLASGRPSWRGESTLQFNKHPYDLTRMRNKLAMDLFRDIPHMGSLRTQFVRMSILNKDANSAAYPGQTAPVDFGLFTHVEKFGKEFLSNRGLPTDANIYKAEEFDFSSGARDALALALDANYKVISAKKPDFELVLSLEADNNNHRPLIDMLSDVNNVAIPFDTTFDKYFDKANYLTWLATSILMGNRDTVTQNFALYQPKDGTKFYFLPWDYDGAFGFEDQPNEAAAVKPLYAQWQKTAANWWRISLHRRFMKDPKHMAELQLAVSQIYDTYLTQNKIKVKTDHYKALIESRVTAAPDLMNLTLLAGSLDTAAVQWARESDRLATAVTTNHTNFSAALEAPMPYWQAAAAVSSASGQKLRLSWDQAVDLQGDAVTYTVQVAATPTMDSPVVALTLAQVGNEFPTYDVAMLPNGTYYLKVTARDNKGNTQSAFDTLDLSSGRYFGVLAFTLTNGVVTL
jgi:spore coat protein H